MFFKKKHDSLYDLGHMNMILTEFPINAIICDKFHVASCYGILEINGHSILTVFRKQCRFFRKQCILGIYTFYKTIPYFRRSIYCQRLSKKPPEKRHLEIDFSQYTNFEQKEFKLPLRVNLGTQEKVTMDSGYSCYRLQVCFFNLFLACLWSSAR